MNWKRHKSSPVHPQERSAACFGAHKNSKLLSPTHTTISLRTRICHSCPQSPVPRRKLTASGTQPLPHSNDLRSGLSQLSLVYVLLRLFFPSLNWFMQISELYLRNLTARNAISWNPWCKIPYTRLTARLDVSKCPLVLEVWCFQPIDTDRYPFFIPMLPCVVQSFLCLLLCIGSWKNARGLKPQQW